MTIRHKIARAFTLTEVLIATAILSVLVLLLTSLLSAVHRTWIAGEQKVSEFQDGRAILELISRELSQAVISPTLQLVQNPTIPAAANQRANSDSIFWQAPAASTANGNLAEIGYYLTEDATKTGGDVYQLKRFYIPADNTNYQIFKAPNQPTDTSAPWVSNFIGTSSLSNTVASGVIAFWVRCYDRNDDLIPWVPSSSLRFNSAAHFQPAIIGQTSSFKYTNATSTAQANLLPVAVEVTLVTIDPQTFKRTPTIPPLAAQGAPTDLPTAASTFNQQLVTNKIQSAHMFSTRVNLLNSGQ